MSDDGFSVELTMDPDGYWGGIERDWAVYITEAPRRKGQVGFGRTFQGETTGWVIAWIDKHYKKLLLRDEVMVATSDDGERRIEWRGGKRGEVERRDRGSLRAARHGG